MPKKNSKYAAEILRYPKELSKVFFFLLLFKVLENFVMNASVFLLQFAKTFVSKGFFVVAMIFFTLYLLRPVFERFFFSFERDLSDSYSLVEVLHKSKIAGRILGLTRDKITIYSEEKRCEVQMDPRNIFDISKSYIEHFWERKLFWYEASIELFSTILVLIGFLSISLLELENELIFFLIVALGIGCEIFFRVLSIKERRKTNKPIHEARKNSAEAEQAILSVSTQTQKHSDFLVENYVRKETEKITMIQSANRKTRIKNILNQLCTCGCTVIIAAISIFESGTAQISVESITEALALVAIYNQLVSKFSWTIESIGRYQELKDKEKVLELDFEQIMSVYNIEASKNNAEAAIIKSFAIKPFKISRKYNEEAKPFWLISNNLMRFKKGDVVLLTGESGSGKTTLLKIFAQTLHFDEIEFDTEFENVGVLKCFNHTISEDFGRDTLIAELTHDPENYDAKKLTYILEGLNLFEDFCPNTPNIPRLLASCTSEKISGGQAQRFSIARTLYNLSDEVQLVAFDEATSALDDITATKVLRFIAQYCSDKIVFVASHQTDLCKQVATRHITVTPSKEKISIVTLEN